MLTETPTQVKPQIHIPSILGKFMFPFLGERTFSKTRVRVSMKFNRIDEYFFNTRKALNLRVVNGHLGAFRVVVCGSVSDGSNQILVEFKSKEVLLNTGPNLISSANTALASALYSDPDFAEIERSTGTYPPGRYQINTWLEYISQPYDLQEEDIQMIKSIKCKVSIICPNS